MDIHGVICYWEWNGIDPGVGWKLVESYPIDSDGYPMTDVKNSPGNNDRCEWDNWTEPIESDDEDADLTPVMGRAVTRWDMADGITLMAFNPPAWCEWIAPSFYEELPKSPIWHVMLEGGWEMVETTVREAVKWLGHKG